MAICGGFLANNGLILHVVHKICNYNIIFRHLSGQTDTNFNLLYLR